MKTKKHVNIAIIACYLLQIVLVGIIINPIYMSLSTNIIYKETVLPELLYYLRQFILYIAYPAVFSLIIYSVYRFSLSGNKWALILPLIGTFIKNFTNFAVDIINGSAYDDSMLVSITIYILIDIIQIATVALVSEKLITVKLEADRIKKKASASLDVKCEEKTYLPFSSLVDRSNPVLVSAFIGSALMAAIQIVSRIRYDIFEGVDEIRDVIDMILYYTMDIATAVVTFLIIVFLLLSYLPKEKTAKK